MKKLIYGASLLLLFANCAKDLNEDLVVQQTAPIKKITGTYVDVSETPEILAAIKDYNDGYEYLQPGQHANFTGRSDEELDLDLEHILKIVDSHGNESYMIAIKKAFAQFEDIYLENLAVFKKGGEFKSMIFRYNQFDDEKAFSMATFTGDLDIFDKDRNFAATIEFEDGASKHIKYAENFGNWGFVIYDDGSWFTYGGGGGTDTGGGSDGFSTGGWSFTGGYGSSGSYGGANNPQEPNPSDPTMVDHTPIVPNAIWPESTTQFDMATRITNRLDLSLAIRTWLRNPANLMTTFEVYDFLQPVQHLPDYDADVIADEVEYAATGGEPFNADTFDERITVNLPPCLYTVFQDVRNLQNGKFGQVMRQFAGANPLPGSYNWNVIDGPISATTPGSPPPAATTSNVIGGIATTTINNYYLNTSTDLSFARTMIHESFHAYLNFVYRYQNVDKSYANLINLYAQLFGNNPDAIHHHLFVQNNIVTFISAALMEYGTLKGYNLTQQYCDDMAWAGCGYYCLYTITRTEKTEDPRYLGG